MFEASLLSGGRTRRTRSVVLSAVAQLAVVAAAVVVPLLSNPQGALRWPQPVTTPLLAPRLSRLRTAERHAASDSRPTSTSRPARPEPRLDVSPALPQAGSITLPVAPDVQSHMFGGSGPWLPWSDTAPSPLRPSAAGNGGGRRADRVVIGGAVQQAQCVACPAPAYPALARLTRTQGVVVLSARIGREGTIEGLQVRSGPALLVEAARNAVAHWRYRPTQLNGERVEVETEIAVRFTLAGP